MAGIVIPCSNAIELGKNLAKELGTSVAEFESRKFPDNEIYFRIDSDLKGAEAVIVQSGYPEPNNSLVEFLLAADAAREKCASGIVAVYPYLPYARQDKRFKPGEALSLGVVSKLLQQAGVGKLITVDVHYRKGGYGSYDLHGLKGVNLSAGTLLSNHVQGKFDLKDLHIVSPDFGANTMIEVAARNSGATFSTLDKTRSGDFEVDIKGDLDVKGKNVLVMDDIISTGRTMLKALQMAKKAGASKVFAGATHGLFSANSLDKFSKAADYLVTTDSVKNKTTGVSLAGEIAGALK